MIISDGDINKYKNKAYKSNDSEFYYNFYLDDIHKKLKLINFIPQKNIISNNLITHIVTTPLSDINFASLNDNEIDIDDTVKIISLISRTDILIYIPNYDKITEEKNFWEFLSKNKLLMNSLKEKTVFFFNTNNTESNINHYFSMTLNFNMRNVNLERALREKILYMSKILYLDKKLVKNFMIKVFNLAGFIEDSNIDTKAITESLSYDELEYIKSNRDRIIGLDYKDYETEYNDDAQKKLYNINYKIHEKRNVIEKQVKELKSKLANPENDKASSLSFMNENEKKILENKILVLEAQKKELSIQTVKDLVKDGIIDDKITYKKFEKNYLDDITINSESITSQRLSNKNSNIIKFEQDYQLTLEKLLINKISLLKQKINIELMIKVHNSKKHEDNNELNNFLLISRNDIIDIINSSFDKMDEIIKTQNNRLSKICNKLITNINQIKLALEENRIPNTEDQTFNFKDYTINLSYTDIFNYKGNFCNYNNGIIFLKKKYFEFNFELLSCLAEISNQCFAIIENMREEIHSTYSQIFMEIQKGYLSSANTSSNISNIQASSEDSYKVDCNVSKLDFDSNSNSIKSTQLLIDSKLKEVDSFILELYKVFSKVDFKLERSLKYYLIPTGIGLATTLYTLYSFYSLNIMHFVTLGFAFNTAIGLGSFILSYYLTKKYREKNKMLFYDNLILLEKFINDKNSEIETKMRLKLYGYKDEFSKKACELVDQILLI